jgi:hypothetical protein
MNDSFGLRPDSIFSIPEELWPTTTGLIPTDYISLSEALHKLLLITLHYEFRLEKSQTDVMERKNDAIEASLLYLYTMIKTDKISIFVYLREIDRTFPLPSACWKNFNKRSDVVSWMALDFTGVISSGQLLGEEFGAYQGLTPFLRWKQLDDRISKLKSRMEGGPDTSSGQRSPHWQALNVNRHERSVMKFAADPEVEDVAATRIEMAGGDRRNEKLVRCEIHRMLSEQGFFCELSAVNKARNHAGKHIRKT